MRVDARVQRRGFARAVLARLEARARELGYPTLRVDTTVGQAPARRLYEASGYEEVGRAVDRTGFETVLFEKRLAPATEDRRRAVPDEKRLAPATEDRRRAVPDEKRLGPAT